MVEAHLVPSIALTYQPPSEKTYFYSLAIFFGNTNGHLIIRLAISGVKGSQGTLGCTPNNVPMVFIVFSRESYGF